MYEAHWPKMHCRQQQGEVVQLDLSFGVFNASFYLFLHFHFFFEFNFSNVSYSIRRGLGRVTSDTMRSL